MKKSVAFSYQIILVFWLVFSWHVTAQYGAITGSSISGDNLKIDIVFDEEIYASTGCGTLTCIEVTDFTLSLTGGVARLGSAQPTTITKLGNYNFTPFWNPGEPNNSGNENYAQHVGSGRLNDLRDCANLPGVLEIINPNQQTIAGYTYITTWPVGSPCAHSYYRSTTSGCWTDEKQKAQNAGGDLLVYNSVEEYQYLVPTFANGTGVANTWIGLSQNPAAGDYAEPAGGWYWDDGTPIDNSLAKVTYQLTFSLIGTPTGDEQVTVNPVTSPRSVFNCGGSFAQPQSSGLNRIFLNDQTPPYTVQAVVSDNNQSLIIRFQEEVFSDTSRSPINVNDFTLSIAPNGSTANFTSPTPLSVTNINNRVFILQLPHNGNHITGDEIVTILPASGAAIYDRAGLPASATQRTSTATLHPSKTGPVYLGMNFLTTTSSGTLLTEDYTYFCDENLYTNYNIAYHTGPNAEPSVGDYLILNYNYEYPHRFYIGNDVAYMHLRGFDKILEVQKSNGLVVAKYNCN